MRSRFFDTWLFAFMNSVGINGKTAIGSGSPDSDLDNAEMQQIVEQVLEAVPRGSRVLAIIPDKTRDDNTHILFPFAAEILERNGAAKFDALVAQGTHSPMTEAEKFAKIGVTDRNAFPLLGDIYDHRWDEPTELVTIGELPAGQVTQITGGLFTESGRWICRRCKILFPWHRRRRADTQNALAGGARYDRKHNRPYRNPNPAPDRGGRRSHRRGGGCVYFRGDAKRRRQAANARIIRRRIPFISPSCRRGQPPGSYQIYRP